MMEALLIEAVVNFRATVTGVISLTAGYIATISWDVGEVFFVVTSAKRSHRPEAAS